MKPRTQRTDRLIMGRAPRDHSMRAFTWHEQDKTPHWLRYGKGHASIELQASVVNPQLRIDASEYGDKSGKRVMLTLDELATRDLRDYLNELLEAHEAYLAQANRINNTRNGM